MHLKCILEMRKQLGGHKLINCPLCNRLANSLLPIDNEQSTLLTMISYILDLVLSAKDPHFDNSNSFVQFTINNVNEKLILLYL